MTVLREASDLTGTNLTTLLEECKALPVGVKTGRYAWERPFVQLNDKQVFPLHFARELVEAILSEINKSQGTSQMDTRCWFNLQKESLLISIFQPRQHLVEILKGSEGEKIYHNSFELPPTVILLDATPSPVLQSYVLGEDTKTVNYEVAQQIEITQLTNSLYTKDELVARDGRSLNDVSRLLGQESRKYKSAAIFCHKAFNPNAGNGPLKFTADAPQTDVTWGHFDRDNKALNSLTEVEFIAIVGHYCHPLDSLRAQVQAFRFGSGNDTFSDETSGGWKIRSYAWSNEDGKGIARRCRADVDPAVQAAVEHSEQAAILQAVGRGRPTLRSAVKPLKVLLLTAVPLGNVLPIARLAEIKELLGESVISLAQAANLAKGRSLRLQYHDNKRSKVAERIIETLEKSEETAAQTGLTYITQPVLARVSRTSLWQLRMLGIDRTVRLVEENKAVCGPELYIYIYKPLQFNFPFVSGREISGRLVKKVSRSENNSNLTK